MRDLLTHHIPDRRGGAMILLLFIIALSIILAVAPFSAMPALAQDYPAGIEAQPDIDVTPLPDQEFISIEWLIMLVISLLLWVGLIVVIQRSHSLPEMRQQFWNILVIVFGVGIFVYALFVNIAAVLPGIFGFILIGALHNITYKWALSKAANRTEEKRFISPHEPEPEIDLQHKDGQRIEAFSETLPGYEPSEAVFFLKRALEQAINSRASDVHFEPNEKALHVRFRVDGEMHDNSPCPIELAPAIVTAAKALADMDIAERRRPQDGSFSGKYEGRHLDFRVATAGTIHGESMDIRILDRSRDLMYLDKLGMGPEMIEKVRKYVEAPQGMIVVSGHSGAGKTTTLYGLLLEESISRRSVTSIEDPIEYDLEHVQQMSINPKAGITFSSALQTILRQDPDVIMIGEVRDKDTASVALEAATTGHLVLSSIHANNSAVSLFRLLNLGVEPYLISSAISCVISQRLVKVLCEQCKESYEPSHEIIEKHGWESNPDDPLKLYKPKGCVFCKGTGYAGRTGVFEMLTITDSIKEIIPQKPTENQIIEAAGRDGMIHLRDEAMRKVYMGITSIEEAEKILT